MSIKNLPDPKTWAWRVKKLNIRLQDFLTEARISRVAFYSDNPTRATMMAVETLLQSKENK